MNALQPALPDAVVLDVFAGSGALGLEALSRGARHVTFVEKSALPLEVLRANIRTLRAAAQTRVVRANALDFARGLDRGAYDLALADPPYERGFAARLAETFLDRPFASELWIEHSRRERLPDDPGASTRRYGDTLLTTLVADHV